MTAQQLRNSILQQAIQGCLVPQDPLDGNASDLLAEILERENSSLPKKKHKTLHEISEEDELLNLPSNWACFYIGDVFFTTSGGTPNKGVPQYYGGDIPWVRSGELKNKYLYDSEIKITQLAIENSSAKFFPIDTVAVAMYGATIGDTTIFKNTMTTNQAICGLFPVEGILPEYIYYFFMERKQALMEIGFGSGQPNISQEKIKKTVFPLPPLAEQRRIVAKIEELMPLVEKYGKAQSELDNLNASLPSRLRQSILQEAIQGKLVPLGEVAKIVTGSTPSKVNNNYYGLDYPFFKPGDLTHQYINKSVDGLSCLGFEAARKLPPNTILVCCIGSLGKCSIIETEGSCNQQINAILPSESYDTKYLYYVIQSPNFIEQMWEKATSTTVTLLNKNKFSEILIPLPPLAEQRRIVAQIEELFAAIDKLK